jgi:Carbohydrate binding domain
MNKIIPAIIIAICLLLIPPVSALDIAASTLPAPAEGMQWRQTFNEDFNGTTIDQSRWRGDYSHLMWAGNGAAPNDFSGITVADGTAMIRPKINYDDFSKSDRSMMHTGGFDKNDAKFAQRGGYFEARLKLPTNYHGEGDGYWLSFWVLPLGKTDNSHCITCPQEEIDIQESYMSFESQRYTTHFNVHDYKLNSKSVTYPIPTAGDLTNSYHNYGLYWRLDGSKYGTVQAYFDGVAEGAPYTLNATTGYWNNPIYMILQVIACHDQITSRSSPREAYTCTSTTSDDNPFYIDHVRAFQEVPKKSTTTPPAPVTTTTPPVPVTTTTPPASAQSIIQNPGFESGTDNWNFYTNGEATFDSVTPGYGGYNAGKVHITSAGTNVQLYQYDLTLSPNTYYQLKFTAKSSTDKEISVRLMKHDSPYTNYGLDYTFAPTNSWKEYTVNFVSDNFISDVNDGRIHFWLGNNEAGDDYYFDNVSIREI